MLSEIEKIIGESFDDLKMKIDKNGINSTWKDICDNILYSNDMSDIRRMLFNRESESNNICDDISELYEMTLAYADKKTKKKLGQYYTPRDVSLYMASKISDDINSCYDKDNKIKLLEPCCGCGSLIFPLMDMIDKPENFMINNLEICDIDETALMICETLLACRYSDNPVDIVNDNKISKWNGDFLSNEMPYHIDSTTAVIANPPYGALQSDYKQYETYDTSDMYSLFFEKSLDAGIIAMITPQSFIGSGKFESLRKVMSEKNSGTVISYDNVPMPIFCGKKKGVFNTNTSNSVRAAITIAKKQNNDGWHVTPMIRFSSTERNELFNVSDRMSDIAYKQGTTKIWYKIPAPLHDTFFGNDKAHTLSELVSQNGEISICVPSSIRYFTSASSRTLNRTSKRILSFDSEKDMILAYALINSSIAYGWQRITDGGMSLSKKTLMTIPFAYPDNDAMKRITSFVRELISRENDNLVIKMNAGKANENIKIPDSDRRKLNSLLVPDITGKQLDALDAFHSNSLFVQCRAWT